MNQAIAFAHYKNGELLGYRQDTFGTLGKDWAKIYHYTKEQVEIVLQGISYTLGEKKPSIGEVLKKIGAVGMDSQGNPISLDVLVAAEEKIYQQGQDAGAFEVRVVKCPDYETEFDIATATYKTTWVYPREDMRVWIEHPENHEVIETHYFSKVGKIELS